MQVEAEAAAAAGGARAARAPDAPRAPAEAPAAAAPAEVTPARAARAAQRALERARVQVRRAPAPPDSRTRARVQRRTAGGPCSVWIKWAGVGRPITLLGCLAAAVWPLPRPAARQLCIRRLSPFWRLCVPRALICTGPRICWRAASASVCWARARRHCELGAQARAAADAAAFLSATGEHNGAHAGPAADDAAWAEDALGAGAPADWAALAAGAAGEATLLDVPLSALGRRTFTARQCACAPCARSCLRASRPALMLPSAPLLERGRRPCLEPRLAASASLAFQLAGLTRRGPGVPAGRARRRWAASSAPSRAAALRAARCEGGRRELHHAA